jgi:class 3 adenylate cyclase/CHASE2 domain-containing sensor protein
MKRLFAIKTFNLMQQAIILAAAAGFVVFLIAESKLGWNFEQLVSRRIEYSIRNSVFDGPQISPRLKILVFDDSSSHVFGSDRLTFEQWAQLIEKISAEKPKKIIIDRRFAETGSADEIEQLKKALSSAGNVVSATSLLPAQIAEKLIKNRGRLTGINDPKLAAKFFSSPGSLNTPEAANDWYLDGPIPELIATFQGIGLKWIDDYGYIRPYQRSASGRVIPHFSLLLADTLEIYPGKIVVDEMQLMLDRSARFYPNLVPFNSWYKQRHIESIAYYLADYPSSDRFKEIAVDDVVLILPGFFTSGTDFKDTAAGRMPGGLIVASVMNALLTDTSFRYLESSLLWIILASFLGGVVAYACKDGRLAFLGFLVLSGAIFSAAMYFFLHHHFISPWLWTVIASTLSYFLVTLARLRAYERRQLVIQTALSNKFSPAQLQQILENPENLNSKAYERNITVMFVDLAGYSKYAENRPADEVFSVLRSLFEEISTIVHNHGGIVNNTLGDGILALFGYRYDGRESSNNHADAALACAIAIQKEMIFRNLRASQNEGDIHPTRIGINTGSICVGDISSNEYLNFTVIGHAVNYAKRLEEGCEIYRIMFGQATRAALSPVNRNNSKISPRLILIKHHSLPQEAYEYDPLADESELGTAVQKHYWKFIGINPQKERISILFDQRVEVRTDYGVAYIADFSKDGLSLIIDSYLANGMKITVTFDAETFVIRDMLDKADLSTIQGEIRWGTRLQGKYQHGIMLKGLSDAQKNYLFECLSEEVARSAEANKVAS